MKTILFHNKDTYTTVNEQIQQQVHVENCQRVLETPYYDHTM